MVGGIIEVTSVWPSEVKLEEKLGLSGDLGSSRITDLRSGSQNTGVRKANLKAYSRFRSLR